MPLPFKMPLPFTKRSNSYQAWIDRDGTQRSMFVVFEEKVSPHGTG